MSVRDTSNSYTQIGWDLESQAFIIQQGPQWTFIDPITGEELPEQNLRQENVGTIPHLGLNPRFIITTPSDDQGANYSDPVETTLWGASAQNFYPLEQGFYSPNFWGRVEFIRNDDKHLYWSLQEGQSQTDFGTFELDIPYALSRHPYGGFLSLSPNQNWMASISGMAYLLLWNQQTGELVTAMPQGGYDLAFSPDGCSLAVASIYQVRIWHLSQFSPETCPQSR